MANTMTGLGSLLIIYYTILMVLKMKHELDYKQLNMYREKTHRMNLADIANTVERAKCGSREDAEDLRRRCTMRWDAHDAFRLAVFGF